MASTIQAPAGPAGHARLLGFGGYRPSRIVTNDEICQIVDSSDEWIRERTGIAARHRAEPSQSVVDMAEAAARDALSRSGLGASAIDTVIVATITHPYQTPAAAPLLADRLGLTGAAFDLGAACAGFCHALAIANDLVRCGTARHVLVVGVEKMSDIIDPSDRGSAFIFGDGAGAAIVGPAQHAGIGRTVWGSHGAQADVIAQPAPWSGFRDGELPAYPYLSMAGQAVFRWAAFAMAPVCHEALLAAGITAEDLDVFVPHQANNRITDTLVKKIGLPADVPIARDIVTTGNTSAASVPLAAERMLREGQARSGDLALLIGFGAGLTYAAQVVVLP